LAAALGPDLSQPSHEPRPGRRTRVIVAGGAQAIVQHITGDDGTGDEAFTRELALIVWHGAFRRPAG
jgi:hypothetical protein